MSGNSGHAIKRPCVVLSVVVPTRGHRASVRRTVESLLAEAGELVEVLVVLNGPEAPTIVVDLPADPRVRTLRTCGEGVCVARNAGAREACGEWLAFVDDDDTVVPGWSSTVQSIRDPGVGLVFTGVRTVDETGAAISEWLPEPMGAPFGHLPGPVLAGNVFIRSTLFHNVGGYDEELRYSENSELALRLAKSSGLDARVAAVVDRRPLLSVDRRTDRPTWSDRDVFEATVHLLEKHHDRLGLDPTVLADHQSIAGVRAARLGWWAQAGAYLRQALRTEPLDIRRWGRATVIHVPLLRTWLWPPSR